MVANRSRDYSLSLYKTSKEFTFEDGSRCGKVLRLSDFLVDLDLVFGPIERPDRGVAGNTGR